MDKTSDQKKEQILFSENYKTHIFLNSLIKNTKRGQKNFSSSTKIKKSKEPKKPSFLNQIDKIKNFIFDTLVLWTFNTLSALIFFLFIIITSSAIIYNDPLELIIKIFFNF